MMMRNLCLASLLLLLGGCSLWTTPAPAPELKLLPPAESGLTGLQKHIVTVSYLHQQHRFILVTRFSQNAVESMALLGNGQPLFEAVYDGEQLKHKTQVPLDMSIHDLFAEMQFSRWPLASLQQHYPTQDGWRIETTANITADTTAATSASEQKIWQRILLWQDQPLLSITGSADALSVENQQQGYSVSITPLK